MSVRAGHIRLKESAGTRGALLPWGRWGVRAAALSYLLVVVAVPLSAILLTSLRDGPAAFWREVLNPVALAALKLTLFTSALTTAINVVMGTATAYVLARYEFPGRGLLNSLVDIPFAIPTLVTGVMLVVLYGPQQTLGAWLQSEGVQVIFATPGIVLALLLVTYPFLIRTVQPVLMELDGALEEAACTMGASKWTTFRTVILPALRPAILTGSLLNFARALGEFGSIIVVAGNIPGRTLTASVYVYGQVESYNVQGASAVSVLLLAISFSLMFVAERLQRRWGIQHVIP